MKGVMLALGLLALALTTVAPPAQSQDQRKGSTTTVTGCLSGPNSEGSFVLQTSSGAIEVVGSELQKHVGHEIKATGTLVSKQGGASQGNQANKGDTSGGGEQVLQVTQVQMIADSCKTK